MPLTLFSFQGTRYSLCSYIRACTQADKGCWTDALTCKGKTSCLPFVVSGMIVRLGIVSAAGRSKERWSCSLSVEYGSECACVVLRTCCQLAAQKPSGDGAIKVWSSYKGRMVDALGQGADEGRSKRRNASGRSKHPLIRRCPNGETRRRLCGVSAC